jgi:hypothetical protein
MNSLSVQDAADESTWPERRTVLPEVTFALSVTSVTVRPCCAGVVDALALGLGELALGLGFGD